MTMAVFTIKEGVILYVSPHIREMLDALVPIWEAFKIPFVITSGLEGIHGDPSLHYSGSAFDVRTIFPTSFENLTWQTHREEIMRAVVERKRLLPFLQFELEKDHLHFEWDERKRA